MKENSMELNIIGHMQIRLTDSSEWAILVSPIQYIKCITDFSKDSCILKIKDWSENCGFTNISTPSMLLKDMKTRLRKLFRIFIVQEVALEMYR